MRDEFKRGPGWKVKESQTPARKQWSGTLPEVARKARPTTGVGNIPPSQSADIGRAGYFATHLGLPFVHCNRL